MKLQDLNRPQRLAVECLDRPCLVLAGAGSGKTGVITRKVAWLIDRGYAPQSIYAVTFTNKAAREMKQRVKRLLGGKASSGLRISTFHSLGQRVLLEEAHRLGFRRGFSIMDARDVETCLSEIAHRGEQDADFIRRCSYRISRWKNDFIDPETALAEADSALEQTQARIYQDYREQLLACNAMDFDDLIMLPVILFRSQPEVLLGAHNFRSRNYTHVQS